MYCYCNTMKTIYCSKTIFITAILASFWRFLACFGSVTVRLAWIFESENTRKQFLPSPSTVKQCKFMLADCQEERIKQSSMQQTFLGLVTVYWMRNIQLLFDCEAKQQQNHKIPHLPVKNNNIAIQYNIFCYLLLIVIVPKKILFSSLLVLIIFSKM